MKNIESLTIQQLEELMEIKRNELNKLFCEHGLNDFTLKKSKELDEIIVKIQVHILNKYEKSLVV